MVGFRACPAPLSRVDMHASLAQSALVWGACSTASSESIDTRSQIMSAQSLRVARTWAVFPSPPVSL